MAIVRLALANPSADSETLLHTATRQSLVSVIATNTSASSGLIDVWVQPDGATSASAYAYQAFETTLPNNNSLETFRFALENNDAVYVKSSIEGVSFSLNAIHDSTGNYNKVTVDSTQPTGPTIGDVWVDGYVIKFWDGSSWVNAIGGALGGGTDEIFYENDKLITSSYTITSDKNAMSAGPITIDTGITVTVPEGSTWSIV